MIRAEVNAEDQINANAKPAKIARMSNKSPRQRSGAGFHKKLIFI